ncbi:MAG: ABC transporter ATP-binding protein [Thermomicrobiales bacterium]|nr:ABC transporter ATP-binding protein [Thermomicrobiales bacterium]
MAVALAPHAPVIAAPASTGAAGGAAVAIDRVSRTFAGPHGDVVAVDDVSLDVAEGEFVVIVGPSGCGKTTLLRMIAGLETPTAGRILVSAPDNRPVRNAMVFQGRSVFPWLSVEANVAYGLKMDGVSRAEQREKTSNLLSLVGLSRFAKAWPHQLSEGMRQRVAIARALAVDPQMLLMDEPFGALDEQTRFILQEELLRIWEATGNTVVFVTHSIDEALTLADRVVVMSAQPGRIKAEIPIAFDRPRDQATVRSDPRFAEKFATIWSLLKEEVQEARRSAGEVVR